MHKQDLPATRDARVVWVYWVSRDSRNGELADKCSLWRERPLRVKHRYRATWVGSDPNDPGHLGDFKPDEIFEWFKVCPETDRELVKVEQGVTERMLKAAG